MSLYETGIRPLVDEHIDKKAEEVRDYGDYWSASSAGYCMRLNVLKRLKIPSVPEIAEDKARTQRVFEAGHIFHEYMQRITKDSGVSIAQELELQDEGLMVRGHIDDLVLIEETYDNDMLSDREHPFKYGTKQHLILYDYKTVNSQAFNYKKDEMGHYHKYQLATYMYLLRKWFSGGNEFLLERTEGKLNGIDITEGRILQISKDDLRQREQQMIWSPVWEKQVVGYWDTLNGYWENKVMPKCTCLDHDGGFMGRRSRKGKIYNPFFHNDEPCSQAWVERHKDLIKDWRF